MTPKQAAAKLGRINAQLTGRDSKILARAQERVYKLAIAQTSGTVSQDTLDRNGNPYGLGPTTPRGKKRGAIPYGDPGKINAQSGSLRSHWNKGAIYIDSAGDLHAPVTNTDDKAYLFDGDPHGHMRARPLEQSIAAKVQGILSDVIKSAIRRVIR